MNQNPSKGVIKKKGALEEVKKTTELKTKQTNEIQKKKSSINHTMKHHEEEKKIPIQKEDNKKLNRNKIEVKKQPKQNNIKIDSQKKPNQINHKEESKIMENAEPSYATLKEIREGLKQFIEEGRDTSDPPPFSLSSKSKEALKLMNFLGEELICLNTTLPTESKPIFSLFFQLLCRPLPSDINEASEQSRAFFSDIWNKATLEGKLLSELFEEKINTFDFSFKNISRCAVLAKGHHSKLDPNYHSKICILAGIITFIVRDALVYGGIAKGEGPTKLYGYLLYKKNNISER